MASKTVLQMVEGQPPWYKPKLLAAAAVFLVGSIAMFFGKLTGGEWVTASTLVLSVFTVGNVMENKALLDAK